MIDPITNPDPIGWHNKVNNAVDYWEGSAVSADFGDFGDARQAMNDLAADMGLPTLDLVDSNATKRSKMNAIIAGLGIPAGLDLYADFTKGRYWDNGPQIVADEVTDTWSGGPLPNAAGVYSSFGANALARNDLGLWTQPARTNGVRNSNMAGGGVGALPTLWTEFVGGNGSMASEKVGVFTIGPFNTFRYRVHGTPATSNGALLRFDGSNANTLAATVGQQVTFSVFVRRVAGSLATLGNVRMQLIERNSGGNLATQYQPNQRDVISDVLTRYTFTITVGNAATTHVTPVLEIAYGVAAHDVTLEIAAPQLELGAFATQPILTTGSAATRTGNRQVIDLTGRLNDGVVGFIKLDLKYSGTLSERVFEFNDGTASQRFLVGTSGSQLRVVATEGGINTFDGYIPLGSLGIKTVVFSCANNYLRMALVGGASAQNILVNVPQSLSKLSIGGLGYTAFSNTYQITQKLGLIYGTPSQPINQALFDQVYALAVAA